MYDISLCPRKAWNFGVSWPVSAWGPCSAEFMASAITTCAERLSNSLFTSGFKEQIVLLCVSHFFNLEFTLLPDLHDMEDHSFFLRWRCLSPITLRLASLPLFFTLSQPQIFPQVRIISLGETGVQKWRCRKKVLSRSEIAVYGTEKMGSSGCDQAGKQRRWQGEKGNLAVLSRIYQGKSDHLKYIHTKLLCSGGDFPETKKLILQAIRIPFHKAWGFFPSLVLASKGRMQFEMEGSQT